MYRAVLVKHLVSLFQSTYLYFNLLNWVLTDSLKLIMLDCILEKHGVTSSEA